jgi:small subunit ribosomal protein S18
MANSRKKRRLMFRRKRTLDPSIIIDYKNPEVLRRFVTDRGKIIPRRISGATAKQQRAICNAVKRARYLALLPYSLGHRQERNFATEMSAIATSAMGTSSRSGGPRGPRSDDKPSPSRDGEE